MALSYLNLYDADAAWRLAHQLADLGPAAAVVVKHANPCGAAVAGDVLTAYDRAFECDPMSAFGGIVALTAPVTEAVAADMVGNARADVLIAPGLRRRPPWRCSPPSARTCGSWPPRRPAATGGTCARSAAAGWCRTRTGSRPAGTSGGS